MPTGRHPAGLLLALLLLSCAGEDLRFSTPATTFRTYREALTRGDAETSWLCLSSGYRQLEFEGNADRWAAHIEGPSVSREVDRLEIGQETEINDRLAFLQFDPSTVGPGRAPFYYFLYEAEGWRITTHLDSLFRVEVAAAIERDDFSLPRLRR